MYRFVSFEESNTVDVKWRFAGYAGVFENGDPGEESTYEHGYAMLTVNAPEWSFNVDSGCYPVYIMSAFFKLPSASDGLKCSAYRFRLLIPMRIMRR